MGRSVEEICSSPLRDSLDIPFRYAVLMVSANAAECESLVGVTTISFESGGREGAVVGVVLLDCDGIVPSERFKMMLAGDGGIRVGRKLAIVEDTTASMIDEKSPTGIALLLAAKSSVEAAGKR